MKKKMGHQFDTNSSFIIFQLATTLILLMLWSCPNCHADTSDSRGSLCSTPPPAGDDESPSWTANLNSVFSSLEANVNLNNGYYRAESGNSAVDKVYGLIQCRGDIPQSDCQNCTRESFRQATERCAGRSVVVWQKRCFLRYSNTSFYGVWERTRFAVTNSTDRDRDDDPTVVEKGRSMMSGLVEEAPKRTLMFATSVTDDGKRYGLAQCTRDLKRSDCEDCLDYLMENTGTEITNKQYWETYAVGCFMLYDDHQFYFNSSTSAKSNPPASEGSIIVWAGRFSVGMAILTTAMAYL